MSNIFDSHVGIQQGHYELCSLKGSRHAFSLVTHVVILFVNQWDNVELEMLEACLEFKLLPNQRPIN